MVHLYSGSDSPKVSQLRPSNGCHIWLGFGCGKFLIRLVDLIAFGPNAHKDHDLFILSVGGGEVRMGQRKG